MLHFSIVKQSASHLDLPGNILRTCASEVDFSKIEKEVLRKVLQGLFYELYASDGGIGLAAPMLGISLRIAIADTREEPPLVLINPEIIERSEEVEEGREANLCLPEIAANVKRPKSIVVRAYDQHGNLFERKAEGMLARVILHELDVLDGKMFHDYVAAEDIITTAPEVTSSKSLSRILETESSKEIFAAHYLNTVTVSRDMLSFPYTVLRKKAAPIDFSSWKKDQLHGLIREMLWLQHHLDGVGIAAPQVGLSVQLTVIDDRDNPPYVLINPHITKMSEEVELGREGCLSIPYYYGQVSRSKTITVEALDINGRPITLEAKDFLARVIQHEVDHLNGILFTDHLKSSEEIISWHPDDYTERTMKYLYN